MLGLFKQLTSALQLTSTTAPAKNCSTVVVPKIAFASAVISTEPKMNSCPATINLESGAATANNASTNASAASLTALTLTPVANATLKSSSSKVTSAI